MPRQPGQPRQSRPAPMCLNHPNKRREFCDICARADPASRPAMCTIHGGVRRKNYCTGCRGKGACPHKHDRRNCADCRDLPSHQVWPPVVPPPQRSEEELEAELQALRASLQPGVEGDTCIICTEFKTTHALLPCGHKCVCAICVDSLLEKTKKCPICRVVTTGKQQVFQC